MKRRSSSPSGNEPFPELPRPSARQLAEDWMRTLTIVVSSEPGTPPEQVMQAVAQANQPTSVRIKINTPLPERDARVLKEAQSWIADVRNSQIGVNMLVETLLIDWLAEATGQRRLDIVQHLALAVENHLPPPQ